MDIPRTYRLMTTAQEIEQAGAVPPENAGEARGAQGPLVCRSWRATRRCTRETEPPQMAANMAADTGWLLNSTLWAGDIACHIDRLYGVDTGTETAVETARTIAARAQAALDITNAAAESLFYPGRIWANGRSPAQAEVRPDQMADALRAFDRGEKPWHTVSGAQRKRYMHAWGGLIARIAAPDARREFDAGVLCQGVAGRGDILPMGRTAEARRIGAEGLLAECERDACNALMMQRIPEREFSDDEAAAEYRELVWNTLGVAYESEEYEWLFSPKWAGDHASADGTIARFQSFLSNGIPDDRHAILDGET